jgi:hypothetical protein
MPIIDLNLLGKYISLSERYKDLVVEETKGEISYDDVLKEINPLEIEELRDHCVNAYSNELAKFDNYKEEYFKDIKEATLKDNLYLIEVLIFSQSRISGLIIPEIDLFLLKYLIGCFKKFKDKRRNWFAKYLFEQVLDTADHDLDDYTKIIDEIFLLNKEGSWYDDFYDQVRKIIYIAPVNAKTLAAVKNGLTGTTEEIKEIIEDYIKEKY